VIISADLTSSGFAEDFAASNSSQAHTVTPVQSYSFFRNAAMRVPVLSNASFFCFFSAHSFPFVVNNVSMFPFGILVFMIVNQSKLALHSRV